MTTFPSLLNSPRLRFVGEDVRSGVDEGQNRPGHEVGEGEFGVATSGRGILNTAPQEQRVRVELGGKESGQLLLPASAAERNKF